MLSSGNCLVLILVESLISWNVHYSPWIVNGYLKKRVHAIFLRWKGFKRQNLKQLPSFHWTRGVNKWTWLNMNCSRMAIITNSMNKSWRGCGENRTLLHCRWECKLVQSRWKTVRRFLRKPKTELPNDPAILVLGVYADKTNSRRDMHLYVRGSTITTAKTWEQSKGRSKAGRIKKLWCMYTQSCLENPGRVWKGSGILLSQKKNETIPFTATWTPLENTILSEINQRETNTTWHHLHVESKTWHQQAYLWIQNRHTGLESGEGGRRGMEREAGASRCKLLFTERMNSKVLLYSTEN